MDSGLGAARPPLAAPHVAQRSLPSGFGREERAAAAAADMRRVTLFVNGSPRNGKVRGGKGGIGVPPWPLLRDGARRAASGAVASGLGVREKP